MIRLIQVGFGASGRRWHDAVLPEFPEVALAACVDQDASVRKSLESGDAADCNAWFESLGDALSAVDADAVLVAAQLEGHALLVEEALRAGKHVVVEKPFVRTVAEAVRLADLAKDAGLSLVVGQNYRFFPAPPTVRRLLAENHLGAVGAVRIDFRHDHGFAQTGDSKHARLDHPLLVDMAVHHFDLLRMVLGSEPVAVSCTTFNPPWSVYRDPPAAFGTMLFPTSTSPGATPGIPVSYRGSWISHNVRTPWSGMWEIECERGSILWQSRKSAGDVSADSVRIRRHDGSEEAVPLDPIVHIDRAGVLEAFLRAATGGEEAECSARDNLGTVRFMNAMIMAAETAATVHPAELRV